MFDYNGPHLSPKRVTGGREGRDLGGASNSAIMKASEWLDELANRVAEQLAEVEVFRASSDTLTLALGPRGITAHDDGDMMWIAPTFAAGGSIASRLESRVQHLDILTFGISEATVDVAVDSVVGHLRV
jgi:hypothetical protein